MNIPLNTSSNPFIALASALWERGDEGEDLARQLAQAFRWIVAEGEPTATVQSELTRLLEI